MIDNLAYAARAALTAGAATAGALAWFDWVCTWRCRLASSAACGWTPGASNGSLRAGAQQSGLQASCPASASSRWSMTGALPIPPAAVAVPTGSSRVFAAAAMVERGHHRRARRPSTTSPPNCRAPVAGHDVARQRHCRYQPEVLRATASSGGLNLWRGAMNFLDDAQRQLTGKGGWRRGFEVGKDVAVTPGKVEGATA